MNETPKSIWTRPWRGVGGALVWFFVLFAILFVAICAMCLASDRREPVSEWLLAALLGSLSLAAVFMGLFALVRWLCNWRNLRRFAFAIVCVVTLFALAWAVENWRGRSAWL